MPCRHNFSSKFSEVEQSPLGGLSRELTRRHARTQPATPRGRGQRGARRLAFAEKPKPVEHRSCGLLEHGGSGMRGFRFALVRAARSRSRAEHQTVQRRRPSDVAQRFSHTAPAPARPSFGIAFDIDGVILRGRSPIGGAPRAIRRLYSEEGNALAPSRTLLHSTHSLKHFALSTGRLIECLASVFVTAKLGCLAMLDAFVSFEHFVEQVHVVRHCVLCITPLLNRIWIYN